VSPGGSTAPSPLAEAEASIYRNGLAFSFTNALTWMIALGAPMVLLAELLGASPFEVGLLYSFVFLLLPLQVMATALLPYFGFRKQFLFGWGTRSLFLVVPFALALMAPEQPRPLLLKLYIASVFFYCFFRSIGTCALLPWLFEILPTRIRGRYFGMDTLVVGLAGVITLLLSSLLFALLEPFDGFRVLFGMSLLTAATSFWFVSRLPEGSRPVVVPLSRLIRRGPELCFRPSHFRRFLSYQILYAVAGYAFVPFSIYYLKTSLQYSQSYILLLTALQFLGMFGMSYIVKEWMDRIGAKPFFILSHLATITFQLFWGLMIGMPGHLEWALPAVYIITGMAMACFQAANNQYMPQICHRRERALSVSLLAAVVGFLGGITSTSWGFVLKDAETGLIGSQRFLAYLITALVIQLFLLYAYLFRLRDRGGGVFQPQPSGMLLRPFRFMIQAINLVESYPMRKGKRRPDDA
jgi:MFS family permease